MQARRELLLSTVGRGIHHGNIEHGIVERLKVIQEGMRGLTLERIPRHEKECALEDNEKSDNGISDVTYYLAFRRIRRGVIGSGGVIEVNEHASFALIALGINEFDVPVKYACDVVQIAMG